MILEIETKLPYNWFRGEVSKADLRIGGVPIQILDVRRAEFRPYDGEEGQLFLDDCVLSFRTCGLLRGKNGAERLRGFIELRVGALQNTVKIPADNIASLRVVARGS